MLVVFISILSVVAGFRLGYHWRRINNQVKLVINGDIYRNSEAPLIIMREGDIHLTVNGTISAWQILNKQTRVFQAKKQEPTETKVELEREDTPVVTKGKARLLVFDSFDAIMSKETRHPQLILEELGIKAVKHVPQSMFDCWHFWVPSNLPKVLPTYLKVREEDPKEFIGWGLSLEDSEEILNYYKK